MIPGTSGGVGIGDGSGEKLGSILTGAVIGCELSGDDSKVG